jgi:hypothetical protein
MAPLLLIIPYYLTTNDLHVKSLKLFENSESYFYIFSVYT